MKLIKSGKFEEKELVTIDNVHARAINVQDLLETNK